ncbi:MAG TPA: hypothetical protein VIT41_09645 [Microlunatus sp.]
MPGIGFIGLRNNGVFVARLGVRWSVDGQGQGPAGFDDDIDLGQSRRLVPGLVGVPAGSPVWPVIDVVWGRDREGSPDDGGGLTYAPGSDAVADYEISGTTLDSRLQFLGVTFDG